jgi:hypothetical protein
MFAFLSPKSWQSHQRICNPEGELRIWIDIFRPGIRCGVSEQTFRICTALAPGERA